MSETVSTAPIQVEQTVRADEIRALTSGKAGKCLPLAFVPLLREDRVSKGHIRIAFDMAETIRPLMNAVNVVAYAHFVPFLAFDRFNGDMGSLNRSYQGIPEPGTGSVIPFFQTVAFDKSLAFFKTTGAHFPQGANINASYLEAYNVLANWRAKNRSTKLPQRAWNAATLAPAYWRHTNFSHVVPDFDQAMNDGQVPLLTATQRLPLRSKHTIAHATATDKHLPLGGSGVVPTSANGYADWANEIFVELKGSNTYLSLANIELAKKTAAFARMREAYNGLDDEHIIDLLMEGIRVPDEALKQPILLDRKTGVFGLNERHAMDGASLDQSVTTGSVVLDLSFRTPAMNVGGVVVITAEIVPEQLFERQQDWFLANTDASKLPNFLRDFLDPEKVEQVKNEYVDVFHGTPTGTFGYAPLNHRWKRSLARIGGKFYRPNPDTFVEDRQRIWAIEQTNPSLNTDFYQVGTLPGTVFADTVSDPFEVLTTGAVQIVGNTVFGGSLEEDNNNYEAVIAQVDTSRLAQV